jgi:23S rRNA (uridine2552-2'-O)-methyltransferase
VTGRSGGGPKGAGGGGRGARELRTRVKTAKGRKLSSTRWLDRQLNDPYVARARREGWRSRAAFKLIEIDDKLGLLKPGARVVDLGCAPGGWLQVAVARSNALGTDRGKPTGRVVGADILPTDPVTGAEALTLDFMAEGADDVVKAALDGQADLVLSDMAASATGHRPTDHLRIVAMCEAAALFAEETLAPGGAFVTKVFQGGAERDLLARLKRQFEKVVHIKPPASRKDSPETYLVATGFRGGARDAEADEPAQ